MPYTDEFKPLLRKCRRTFGFDKGTELALQKADQLGIKIEGPRKPRVVIQKQKDATPFEYEEGLLDLGF